MKSLLSILLCLICIAIVIRQSFGYECYACTEFDPPGLHPWSGAADRSKYTVCQAGAGGVGKKFTQTITCPLGGFPQGRCSTTMTSYTYQKSDYKIFTYGCSTTVNMYCKNQTTEFQASISSTFPFDGTMYSNIERMECPCRDDFCNDQYRSVDPMSNCVRCMDQYVGKPVSQPTCKEWEAEERPTTGKYAAVCANNKGCFTMTHKYNYEEEDELITVTGSWRDCLDNVHNMTCVNTTETEDAGKDELKMSLEEDCRTLKTFSSARCECRNDFCNRGNDAKKEVCKIFKEMKKAENPKDTDKAAEGTADVVAKSSSTMIFLGIVMSLLLLPSFMPQ